MTKLYYNYPIVKETIKYSREIVHVIFPRKRTLINMYNSYRVPIIRTRSFSPHVRACNLR